MPLTATMMAVANSAMKTMRTTLARQTTEQPPMREKR